MSNNSKEYILVHHSVSNRDNTTIQDIDSWHKVRWPNFKSSLGFWVGYGYVITGDGTIIQTRSDDEEQAHTRGWNSKSIGICLTGDFRYWEVSSAQQRALEGLLNRLRAKYSIPLKNVRVHGEVSRTECPGLNLAKWVKEYRTPTIDSLQKQIALIVEAIKRLQKLYNRLFKK